MKTIKTKEIEIKNKFRNIYQRSYDGIKAELFVLEKMLENQIPFSSLDRRRQFDICAHNKRIEVKSARKLRSRKNVSIYCFNFSTQINRRKKSIGFDYAICVCTDKRNQSYIIPSSFFYDNKLGEITLKRVISVNLSKKNDPVHKFKNTWGALRENIFSKTE